MAKTDDQRKTADQGTPEGDGPKSGKTSVEQQGEPAPRLPHERDQSSDSQQNQDGSASEVGKQALKDVERGVVDTDRGPEADRVYNDKVKR